MRKHFMMSCLLLTGMAATGCRQAKEPASPEPPAIPESATQVSPQDDLAMVRYDTGEDMKWPDYQFPLEHSFEVPEVPPEIVGPFSPEDIPATADED